MKTGIQKKCSVRTLPRSQVLATRYWGSLLKPNFTATDNDDFVWTGIRTFIFYKILFIKKQFKFRKVFTSDSTIDEKNIVITTGARRYINNLFHVNRKTIRSK